MAALYYYAATVIEFFSDDLDADAVRAWATGVDTSVEVLARARQDFALGPSIVWEAVETFRDRVSLADPWTMPSILRVATANPR